jgi:hypothetical protein
MRLHLSLITLGVADVANATQFYERLGLRRSADSQEAVSFFDLGGVVLGLYGRTALAEDATVDPAGTGFQAVTLAHNVATADAVADVLAQAVAAGGRLVKPAQKVFWGGTSGYFADPDGHLWEVAHNPFWPINTEGRLTLPPPGA